MRRTEKALVGNFQLPPVSWQHAVTTGKPTPPSTVSLSPEDLDRFQLWQKQRESGTLSPGWDSNLSPDLAAMIANYETYYATSAYTAWAFADNSSRMMQWRLWQVDVVEQANTVLTKPVSGDSTGMGANPIAPDVPISPDVSDTAPPSDFGYWINEALVANFVCKEVPSGAINGTNATFTLANNPAQGTEHVFKNGLLQTVNFDYFITGNVISFAAPPASGNKIVVTYIKYGTTVPWTAHTYTAYTGGAPNCLDWEQTTSLATDGTNLRWVVTTTSASMWCLRAGADAASGGVIRPVDFNASTNAKVWKRVLGL